MLFGGIERPKSCYIFSPSTQQWTRLQDLPTKRCYHNSTRVKNKIFLIGCKNSNTIEQYEVSSKTFKIVATIEKHRSNFGQCPLNNEMLLIAGGCGIHNRGINNDCFLFNTSSNQFHHLPSMNT